MNLKIFSNKEFGEIRAVTIDNEPWFVGKDVAESLGYSNARDTISKHVDKEDKGVAKCDTLGGKQNLSVINESGLYALIFGSKLDSAKKFKHWVTSEVLPSIRKNGGYVSNQENLTNEQILANAMLVAQNVIAEKEKQITEMKPKALFADAVATSHTSILVGELAKILKQNGMDIGGTRLFQKLREDGYLIRRRGTDWNMPTQRSMEMKLFEIKESTHLDANGCNVTTKTPKVTGKGQQYFINRYLGKEK